MTSERGDHSDYCLGDYKRRLKSIHQNIILLGIHIYDNDLVRIKLLGVSNQIYTITVATEHEDVIAKCDCPDATMRNYTCKHLYWLGIKHFGVTYPKYWKREHIDNFVCKHIKKHKNESGELGRNNICSICLESIDYKNDLTLQCEEGCHNSVHTICWKKYYFTTYSDKCVYCRSIFLPFDP